MATRSAAVRRQQRTLIPRPNQAALKATGGILQVQQQPARAGGGVCAYIVVLTTAKEVELAANI
eukprot:SAG22_NODE_676_length_7962_cov_75.623681_2_plen_64_part_00